MCVCVYLCVWRRCGHVIFLSSFLSVWTCGCVLSQVMLYSYLWIYQDTYYISYDITCIGILYTYRSTCSCACDKCLPSFSLFCGSLVAPPIFLVFLRVQFSVVPTHTERGTLHCFYGGLSGKNGKKITYFPAQFCYFDLHKCDTYRQVVL